jgi:thymidine kinase
MLGETAEYEPLIRAAFYKAMLKERIAQLDVVEEPLSGKPTPDAPKS